MLLGDERREINVRGGEGVRDFKVGARGRRVGLEIECESVNTRIAELSVITSVIR